MKVRPFVSCTEKETSARMRRRIHLSESFIFLLWTAVAACNAEGSIHNVSLNMDGLLTVTNQNQNVVSVLCRVTHNISNISLLTSFFYLNDTELDRTSDLERDGSVNTFVVHDRCYMPPFQSHCEELTLVLRTISQINNTRITCKSRARVDTMSQLDSREVITVIVEDPESPSCSPPSPSPLPPTATSSSSPSPSSSSSPSPSPSPEVDPGIDTSENRSPSVIPEGRERVYVVALAVETVLLIAAVLFSLFLLLLYCKSKRKTPEHTCSLELPADTYPEDNKTTCTSHQHTAPYTSRGQVAHPVEEPRYVQCSNV